MEDASEANPRHYGPASPAVEDDVHESTSPAAPGTSAASGHTEQQAREPQVILTPSKLRLHSSVLAVHATANWLMASVFCIVLLIQVRHSPTERLACLTNFRPRFHPGRVMRQ